ncbi:hypothetical protein KI688_012870 [Linnemannia hyalina]|uniref:F-box domain-containing protein n=1 Tax=Linnemannia hyalina TaxID=64524 RepID=A0A9P7XVI7_9FUNG|nr:hypothetical protein KI688_012870 [Linnemannia hyalina]
MGTDDATSTDASQGQPTSKRLTPLEIPELLYHIASYLTDDHMTLGEAAQVSSSFHAAFTPLFWRRIVLDGEDASEIWGSHRGFRMGMIRYGRFVEELQLTGLSSVQDGDVELMAENFTRLREEDEEEDDNEVVEEEGLDGIGRDGAVDAETRMIKYREYTETETEHEFDSQYESMGILNPSSTATESEQDRPTGSIPHGSASSSSLTAAATGAARGVRKLAGKIPLHRQSGTTRPAKFKGTKTQFPFFLEELVLNRCRNLTGASVLKLVSRLGPQLKRLHLNHVAELSDRDVLDFMKHVPQLVEINVKGTDVTDTFLQGLAELTAGAGSEAGPGAGAGAGAGAGGRAGLEALNLNMLNVSPAGLIPLIKANKSTFKSLALEHNHAATNEVLYAFIEVPNNDKKATAVTQKTQSTKKGASSIPSRAFSLNTVLTSLRVSYCTTLSEKGFAILFTAATELQTVEIDGTSVGDESLLALAATYRDRMKRLGYGVPASWREFEIAEDEILIAEHAKKPSEAGAAALLRKTLGFDPTLKVYSGHTVTGGLRRLSMKHCPRITNKGLRAIVRSCVNLEGLNVSNCGRISIEIFNGPWACTQLVNLMIAGMPLELMPGTTTGYTTLVKEETLERQRFPLQEEEFPAKWEFNYQGYYDYIVIPTRESDGLDDEDDEDEDEGDDEELLDDASIIAAIKAAVAAVAAKQAAKNKAKKAASAKAETIRCKFPADGKTRILRLPPLKDRNTNAQRALLKQFYTKLGLLKNLYYFDMSQCCFRVRPKDGLDLVLPGLQQSLDTWNLYRPPGYTLHDSDLEFFGRYFGQGREDCPIKMEKLDIVEQEQRVVDEKAKKAEKAKAKKAAKAKKPAAAAAAAPAKAKKGKKKAVAEEEDDEDEDEDEGDDLPRVAKLDQLIVSKFAMEDDLDYEVYEWFMDQDVDLVQIDEFDYDMM